MVIDRLIICPAPKQKSAVWRVLSLTVADRIEAVVLRITELTGACRRDSGRFRIRMSISSTDHIVVPENDEVIDLIETADVTAADITDADPDAPDIEVEAGEPQLTFGDLGLPEGVVRKLTQNGVTSPF